MFRTLKHSYILKRYFTRPCCVEHDKYLHTQHIMHINEYIKSCSINNDCEELSNTLVLQIGELSTPGRINLSQQ